MNQTENSQTQDDDIDRTMEDEERRVRMDAILTWPPRRSAPPTHEPQNGLARFGKTWARSGVLAGKDALKTSAGMLERVAGLLKHLAASFKKDTVEA